MYYSTIGLLAILVLLIENQDLLFQKKEVFRQESWKIYKGFLIAVLVYYVTDVIWGILEQLKLSLLLFIDTEIYFIAMAVGIVLWTSYVVSYIGVKNGFGIFLEYAGRVIATFVTLVSVANIFTPILFLVDENCSYHAYPLRYVILIVQIMILVLISANAFIHIIGKNEKLEKKQKRKYRTVALFGLIMAIFLTIQVFYPLLPVYSIAFMLGTCLLRALVIADEYMLPTP